MGKVKIKDLMYMTTTNHQNVSIITSNDSELFIHDQKNSTFYRLDLNGDIAKSMIEKILEAEIEVTELEMKGLQS